MNVLFSFAADYANKEQSGKVNVLGIFNRIMSREFPTVHRSLYLVFKLTAQHPEFDVEHDLKIVFVGEDGKEYGAIDGKFVIKRPENESLAQSDFIFEIRDLGLPKPGLYEFRLVINKEVRGSIPLDVIQLEQPPEASS